MKRMVVMCWDTVGYELTKRTSIEVPDSPTTNDINRAYTEQVEGVEFHDDPEDNTWNVVGDVFFHGTGRGNIFFDNGYGACAVLMCEGYLAPGEEFTP